MRTAPHSTPWGRILLAVQNLKPRRMVETVPTIQVGPAAPPDLRKIVEVSSSRFAPVESAEPPFHPTPRGSTELVTAVPVFATSGSARRSSRAAGSPGAASVTTTTTPPPPVTPTMESAAESVVDSNPSRRRSARAWDAHRTGARMVTVGDYFAVADSPASVTREQIARESYALKSRALERAADERLVYEQQLVERRIREQLEANQRELDSSLDEILEDTIILPRSIVGN